MAWMLQALSSGLSQTTSLKPKNSPGVDISEKSGSKVRDPFIPKK